jgi:hypothetical protein
MCLQAHDLLSGVLDKAHKLLSADLDIYKLTLATFFFANSKPLDRSNYPNNSYVAFLFPAKGLSICSFILTTSLLVLTSCSNELLAVALVNAFAGLSRL